MVYELPSSFSGGMQGAVESLKKGILPQATKPVVVPPAPMITQEQKTFLPQKPKPVDPNKTPDVFKAKFVAKYPEGVAQDGRKYKDIPAVEIVAKIVRKYPNGVTSDGIPYTDFLPRPASSSDSLEYRLSQIESLYGGPKSQFFTDGIMRGQTEKEQQFTTNVTKREKEGELVKTLKAPYRAVYSAMETPSQGLQMAVSDVLDLVGADETSKNLTKQLVKDKFEQDMLNQDNKGLIGGIQAGSPSSIIGSLVTAIPNLLLYANPVGATAGIVSTGGGLSLEGEMQGQTGFGDKVIAYSAGTISGLIDKISGQKFIDGLLSKGIEKNVAKSFVDKTINFLKTLKPSDFEAGTEVIQQKIENWGRQLMGTEYDKGWKQYAEAGLMGKILGKVSDVGQSQAPITTLPPAAPKAPRVDAKNIETLKTIKVGKRANNNVIRNEERGFDPYTDIATHQEIVPSVDKTGLVRTTEQVQNLEDTLDPINDALTQSIKDEGVKISLDEFLLDSMNEAKQYENEGASYDRYVNQIKKDFEVYKRFTDEQGRIDLSKINEIKKAKYGISNFSDVESDKANKMVGKAAKELVEKYTTGESTKAINRELSRWYSARDLLLAMDGKTVKGGRLGKMAARVGGNIIGSYFGPLGSFAGGEISAAVQGQMMKGSLRKPSGTIDSESVLSKIPKRTTPQLPPPSGKPTSAKVVDVKPITGFLPGLLQKSESALSRQISSNNMEDKTTQSQLVQVLGGKRKKEVVSPKKESAGNKVNNPIIQKLAKKQETPKTSKSDYLSTTEAKMTDTELKSLAKKYLESSKLPVGKGRVSSDNMADYKGYARIRDYFKAQGDDSLLETKLTPKTPQVEGKTAVTVKYTKGEAPLVEKLVKQAEALKPKADEVIVYQSGKSDWVDTDINKQVARGIDTDTRAFIVKKSDLIVDTAERAKEGIYKVKPKSSLPLSSKSEVKYSKPIEDGKVMLDSLVPSARPMGEKTLADLKYTGNKAKTAKTPATRLPESIKKAQEVSDIGGDGEVGNYHIDDVMKKIKNGRIKVYHGTSMERSDKIGGWADLKPGTYLSLTKGAEREAPGVYGAKYYADIADKYGKEGIVREFDIPIDNIAVDDITGEIRFIGNN